MDELVGAAGLCWAADRRSAAALLLERAVEAASDLAATLPASDAGGPAVERLVGVLPAGRRRERDAAALRASLSGAALNDPALFAQTTQALRRLSKAVRLLDPRARRRRRIWSALGALAGVAVAVGIVLVVLANVERPEDRVFGGSGGRPYETTCRAGARVVGADIFVDGATLTGVRPICLSSPGDAGAEPIIAPTAGRARGAPQSVRCAPSMVAVGITGKAGARVDRFTLLCGPFDDPESETVELRGVGGAGGTYFRARCREGAVAGFRGSAGAALDAIGAICLDDGEEP